MTEGETCLEKPNLSPAKRALLAKWARGEGTNCDHGGTGQIPGRLGRNSGPLSFAQRRLWFLDRLEPFSPLYNVPVPVRLYGDLNPEALRKALSGVVARHEAIRTRFVAMEADPVQKIEASTVDPLQLVDLTMQPVEEREAEAMRLLREESRRPFNLSSDLMLRALLVRTGEREWYFIVVMHHIASDAWSWQVICRELGPLYAAAVNGTPDSLPPLALQYADFAEWQLKWWGNGGRREHLAYWRGQLANAPSSLDLATDRPRPAVQTYRGECEYLRLTPALGGGLRALSQREGATLFMTLLAAFKALLHRHTGQDDLVVGSPVAGRERVELESLVGLFVNTLVLRTSLAGNPTFRELLGRVREVVLQGLAHQAVPLEKLVEELQVERSSRQSPLIQTMFVLQEALAYGLRLPGVTSTALELDNGTAKFDLTLTVTDDGEALTCVGEYNADLFEKATIRRMLVHYRQLLEGIVAAPDQRLSDLPLLTEPERHQLISEWNQTRMDFPGHACVHELVEEQARKTPGAPAAEFEGKVTSYRELEERSTRLARHLRTLGVGPEVLAGIFMERSVEMIVGLLAVLKAGGAYVPLDLRYPKDRLAYMLEDARPAVLITQSKWLDAPLPFPDRVVCIDTFEKDYPGEMPEPDLKEHSRSTATSGTPTSDNLAYVIYTSGSTGRPKGVEIRHRAVVNFLTSMRERPGMNADDVLLAVTPLSFDIAALELFLPLTVGARVVIAPDGAGADADYLSELMSESGVTVMQATPATWRLFVESGWPGNPRLKILCGGEALPRGLADELSKRCRSLWNLYGPTETTIWSTAGEVTRGTGPVPIGHPIGNTRIYLLDHFGEPAPVGVPGELCIGGEGVARGYRNRPELTLEKFVPDRQRPEPGARLYKTGDRARYLQNGDIEFLGRLDQQVKIRGFRIELEEIETLLNQHPAIRETVVIVREDTPGVQRLVAYAVPRSDGKVDAGELRRYLNARLPSYSVPSAFVAMEALPRTPNGKLDRRALPAPDIARSESDDGNAAPVTRIEERVAEIWRSVLGTRSIGRDENFFEIGGHSLLAMQVIARVRQLLQVELPLPQIFQTPTVAGLAGVIGNLLVAEIECQNGGRPEFTGAAM